MDKWGPLKTLIALKNTFFYYFFLTAKLQKQCQVIHLKLLPVTELNASTNKLLFLSRHTHRTVQ